jgi:radical SAM superfamily enzyme YgiQ (UPF0313 family)
VSRPLRILLVRPRPAPATIGLQHLMVVEPLELEVLAALARPEDRVEIADMILDERSLDEVLAGSRPDVFGVTGYITHIPGMLDACRTAKAFDPRVRTVVGGVHVERFPEVVDDPAVDLRVVRNATTVFPRLLDHLRDPAANPVPPGVLRAAEPLDRAGLPPHRFDFPVPRRDLTARYRRSYFYVFHDRVALIKTSFGCPYACSFCFPRGITDDIYVARPLTEVVDELEGIAESEIYIIDDDFLVSAARLGEFLALLRARRVRKRYLCFGRADFIAGHPDLIAEFRSLGLRTIIVGLESFSDGELDGYVKASQASDNVRAIEVMRANGVDCYAGIIVSPAWGPGDFARLRRALRSLGVKFINLQPLTPLPGTGLAVEASRLVVDRTDYARWDLANVTIRPERMPLADFYREIIRTYTRVMVRPAHLLSHAKYPLGLQWRLAKGVWRVRRQYLRMYREARCPS